MFKIREGKQGQEWVLDQPRLNIGRDPSNDLVLDDPALSGFHATIFFEDDRIELVDLGSANGTLINGNPLTGRSRLKAWDIIRLGDVEMELVDTQRRRPTRVKPAVVGDRPLTGSKSPASPAAAPTALLRLLSPGGYPAQLAVSAVITVGREQGNDLILGSELVSARHAELRPQVNGLEVIDLNSRNGTYVNGGRVDRQLLNHGDVVGFDRIEYRAEVSGQGVRKTRLREAVVGGKRSTVVRPASEDPVVSVSADLSQASGFDEASKGVTPASTPVEPVVEVYAGESGHTIARSDSNTGLGSEPGPWSAIRAGLSMPSGFHRAIQPPGVAWLLLSLQGRIPRLAYFLSVMVLIVVVFIPIMIAIPEFSQMDGSILGMQRFMRQQTGAATFLVVSYLVLLWPSIALMVKRLHDINLPGGWAILGYVPFVFMVIAGVLGMTGDASQMIYNLFSIVSFIFGLVLLFKGGTKGTNIYGEPRSSVLR